MALLTKDCSNSDKLAHLSPKALALYFLILAQLNNHGKMKGAPAFVKEDSAPKISWLTLEDIASCLLEITTHTNIKWFRAEDGIIYIHSINFKEHNPNIRKDRLGMDRLPSYSGESTPIIPGFAGGTPPIPAEIGAPGGENPLPVPGAPAKTLITFNLKTDEWTGITDADYALWHEKYPLVDVEHKLISMGDWLKRTSKGDTKKAKEVRERCGDLRLSLLKWFGDDQKKLAATGQKVPAHELEADAAARKREYDEASKKIVEGIKKRGMTI